MNKFKKIGLSALAGSLVAVSAQAADISMTGGASMTFTGGSNTQTGNGWAMNDNIAFSWGGELDNGMTVDVNFLLDNGDGTGAQIFDNRSLALGMGDAGTLTFWGNSGDGVISANDDKMPAAYEESFTGADAPTQGAATSNMFWYNNSSLMDGLSVDLSYTPSSTTEVEGSTEAGITYTGVEGLTLSYNKGKDKGAGALAHVDNQIFYATYAYGPVTLGFQENEADSEVANGDEDYSSMAISYAVSEELSLSYGVSKLDYESATLTDQESVSIGASYTMGSMTFSGTHNRHDNISGADASDRDWYELAVSFAF